MKPAAQENPHERRRVSEGLAHDDGLGWRWWLGVACSVALVVVGLLIAAQEF